MRSFFKSARLGAAIAVATAAIFSTGALAGGVEPGDHAPDFTLTDIHGVTHHLSDYTKAGKVVVLEWFNPDCPFVMKHHKRGKTMKKLASEFKNEGVVWLAINSGAPGEQGTGLERNLRAEKEYQIDYPIMFDESGEVGRAYGATNTPHMFIIGRAGEIVYAGAIDNAPSPVRFGDVNYVRTALKQYLAGETVDISATKAYGCSVKYTN